MRTYLVSYDLANPTMNEPYITDAIMALGEAWARPLATVWYLRTDAEPSLIENRLARLLDVHDGLLVQAVREDAAFRNTGLRWFRRRRSHGEAEAGNIVAFPMPAETIVDTDRDAVEREPLRAAS
jgi:hypothetical protein